MLNKTHTVDHNKEGFNFFWICFLPFIESRTGLYDAPVLGNEVLCIPGMKYCSINFILWNTSKGLLYLLLLSKDNGPYDTINWNQLYCM